MENGFLILKKKDRMPKDLTILCSQHRKTRATSVKENKLTRSKKPIGKEEQCRFRFQVKYNKTWKQYYMFREGCGCSIHNDHVRMKLNELQPTTDILTEDEINDILNQLSHMVSTETVRTLLQSKISFMFDRKQLNYLNQMKTNVL